MTTWNDLLILANKNPDRYDTSIFNNFSTNLKMFKDKKNNINYYSDGLIYNPETNITKKTSLEDIYLIIKNT